jgi:hypothetical protein
MIGLLGGWTVRVTMATDDEERVKAGRIRADPGVGGPEHGTTRVD